jgi:hypothetical protein
LLATAIGCASQNAPVTEPAVRPPPATRTNNEASASEPANHAGQAAAPPAASEETNVALEKTASEQEQQTPEARLSFWKALYRSPRHHPAELDREPRVSRLTPGAYACRVSKEYRLRDCFVEQRDGRTFLEVSEGNLLAMRGVLWDEGATIQFEGFLLEEQPFGCTSCQDRCYAYPGSCACDPLPAEAIRECLQQPLRITFRAVGKGRYQGLLDYSVYYNEYVGEGSARHAQGYSAKPEKFEVLLVTGPPPAAKN